jgi:hypothetical protein
MLTNSFGFVIVRMAFQAGVLLSYASLLRGNLLRLHLSQYWADHHSHVLLFSILMPGVIIYHLIRPLRKLDGLLRGPVC